MKERPILFSAPMVRALLDGSKTQTRRVMARQKKHDFTDYTVFGQAGYNNGPWKAIEHAPDWGDNKEDQCSCPYATHRGDRLWVRETWAMHPDFSPESRRFVYRADPGSQYDVPRWTPAIHMFRWASRITLEVTGVRVERLQDISEADALAEGVKINVDSTGRPMVRISGKCPPVAYIKDRSLAVAEYASLWESINGPGSWAANPWVWVIEFKRVDQPQGTRS